MGSGYTNLHNGCEIKILFEGPIREGKELTADSANVSTFSQQTATLVNLINRMMPFLFV